jgi:hypothetical protein
MKTVTMKTVTMTVLLTVEVPDKVDTDLLHLGNGLEDFRVEEAGDVVGAKVTAYETVSVE